MIVKIVSMKLRTIVKKDFLNIGKCNKKKKLCESSGTNKMADSFSQTFQSLEWEGNLIWEQ